MEPKDYKRLLFVQQTLMMNIRNPSSKRKVVLKALVWSNWYFCNITEPGWFWKRLRNKVSKNHFLKSVWKSNCPEVHSETLDSYFQSNDKVSASHTRFDQTSDNKHDIYLYGMLSTKLLTQQLILILSSCSQKLEGINESPLKMMKNAFYFMLKAKANRHWNLVI